MRHKVAALRYAVAVLVGLGSLLTPHPGAAHPLGNFTISHYANLRFVPQAIELHYLVDMAEIPTFQEVQATGIVPEAGHPGLQAYLDQKSQALQRGLLLAVNG